MKVQVAKWGNSTAVRLPKAVVRQLGLRQGMTLDVSVEGKIVKLAQDIEPLAAMPRPDPLTLEWIVSEMRRLGPDNEPATVEWGPDIGAEIVDDGSARR
jgi:antitoxin MazE